LAKTAKTTTKPVFCFQTDLQYDLDRILEEYRFLMSQVLHEDPKTWMGKDFDINLVHRPEKEGRDRFLTEAMQPYTYDNKYKDSDFTQFCAELEGGYIHSIYKELNSRSTKGLRKFRLHNRMASRYISWHRDPHSGQRYHIALWTNEGSLLLGKKTDNILDGIEGVHIPADGSVWELKANDYDHAVINMGNTARCHLLASDWDD
jgi:hypothetical protein